MKSKQTGRVVGRCEAAARALKQLSHPGRLRLLCHLSGGPRSVGELERLCGVSQSQVSQFLGRMRAEGLVSARRDGPRVHYRIRDAQILRLIRALHRIFDHGR